MSVHVKINDDKTTPWEDIIDDIENDLDENMMGAKTSVQIKLGEVQEKISKTEAKLKALTEVDVYYRSLERTLSKLERQSQSLIIVLQKLNLMRQSYNDYIHVRDLPSYSTPEIDFSDITPILADTTLTIAGMLPTYPEYDNLPQLFEYLKKKFMILLCETMKGRQNTRTEREQSLLIDLLYNTKDIKEFLF
ncbi:hypothetical protein TVAGG3_0144990 [Trichomonas vaginalis G3]|uniref:hypothetical protein n=1 Tax=Trichomonas vaginalis (strain ATCC PRA-98 / G3) TaxID=412133 RepID=UPI0021E58E5A|nr:hypothetical protein TVAGG3_0144990 [Trichomonas vaginalis G3]KAI5546852.1 hypothetical protein TVAGG3_0144990 [Trichomonas vaginalis G3]